MVSHDLSSTNPDSITIVGHSHGGNIALMASAEISALIQPSAINILTLNTPCVVGGPRLADSAIDHYNVISGRDKISPIAGFNKTGVIEKEISNDTLWQRMRIGEFSYRRSMNSGELGSVSSEFPDAVNLFYEDQYWLKGLNIRRHFTKHQGYLKKNAEEWIPLLQNAVNEKAE